MIPSPWTLDESQAQTEKDAVIRRLSFRLESRPTATELQDKNILKLGVDIEPASQADQVKQEFEERKDTLKSILKRRERISWLENANILRGISPEKKKAKQRSNEATNPPINNIGGETDTHFVETIKSLKQSHIEKLETGAIASSSSSSSLDTEPREKKAINFVESVEIMPTFMDSEYSRRPDASSTFLNLNNKTKKQIREELNEFKRGEMAVHELSQNNTVFH